MPTPMNNGRRHATHSPGAALRACVQGALLVAVLFGAAACGRPITVQAFMQGSTTPVEDVRIYRYRFSWFSIFPGMRSTQTKADGSAEVSVGPSTTNLTMLRAGFEPVLMGVFETQSIGLQPDDAGYNYVLTYDALQNKQVVPIEFRPVRRAPVELTVTDRATGKPISGAEVFAATFLYLPQPGVEGDWGFPAVQETFTDAEGRAVVDQVSGFRNRIAVRMKGYQNAAVTLDGREVNGAIARDVQLRPLSVKQVDFLVIDAKTRAPVADAEVSLGTIKDGLPDSPDAWVKRTGSDGRTGLMPVPDIESFLMSVNAKGYGDWRGAPVWRALDDGQTKKLELRRK
ncbi:MAG: carboxypeptidase regulatory-like domain-containing protein [Phycisphaerae bacterium]|nr:carboxypeptidase regulatory-like domain-containing protein [Phycisphaerae bacterium]